MLTETVELGVLVPYPEEGREANDQRRPSVLSHSSRDREMSPSKSDTESINKKWA